MGKEACAPVCQEAANIFAAVERHRKHVEVFAHPCMERITVFVEVFCERVGIDSTLACFKPRAVDGVSRRFGFFFVSLCIGREQSDTFYSAVNDIPIQLPSRNS